MPKKQPVDRVICVVCAMPIEAYQRPSVQLETGQEMHAECYTKWQELQRKRVD